MLLHADVAAGFVLSITDSGHFAAMSKYETALRFAAPAPSNSRTVDTTSTKAGYADEDARHEVHSGYAAV